MRKMKRSKSNDSNKSEPKRTKKSRRSNPSDGIEKSQRLLRSSKKKSCASENQSLDKKNALGLVCGKPMPPLSELEKMYEGSDDEMPEATQVATSVDIETPEEKGTPVSNGALTPTTAKKYADEMLKILNSLNVPQPIIPMKKYKKPEVPYIVGCTERPRIPENPNCNVFKGDDYGITSKTNASGENEDEDSLNTPGFYLNGYTLSKSIFNAKANEIASNLLSNENNPVIGNSDSDDTVVYELNSPKNRFSPEPSTSKDSETILKNDQKFIESFVASKKSNNEMDNKVEPFSGNMVIEDGIINTDNMKDPSNSETVNLNPESSSQANQTELELVKNNDSDIEIIEQPCETIEIIDDEMNNIGVKPCTYLKREDIGNNNSGLAILDVIDIEGTNKTNANLKRSNKIIGENTDNSPIVVEDYYNPYDPTIIDEIDLTNVSVDDVISENQSIIDKYSKRNTLSTVKVVDDNVTNMQFGSKNNQTSIIQTTNNQHHSNENCNSNALENNIEELCSCRICSQNTISNIPIQRIIPESSLNNSSNRPDHRIIPQSSLNNNSNRPQIVIPQSSLNNGPNKSIQSKNKKRMKDNNINPSQNISPNNNNSETPAPQLLLGTICPICLDELTRETVGSTNCGHLFCMPCITTALKTKPKRCPTCRKKLSGLGYHQIFM